MLYQFEILNRKLNEWLFPAVDENSGFRVIKGVDFEKAYKAGSISFETDGIYLDYEGKKFRGYMFIKEPYISEYGTYPKFHLTKCETIQQFIIEGRFKIRYEWANSNVNDLIDKTTRQIYKDEALNYCSYCKKALFDGIRTTEDFYNSLDKSQIEEESIEVDIFGYVKGKENISKTYRKKKGFVCESCGIKSEKIIHNRYWHTHHKDGDKTNNRESNLECLCVLCHSFKDIKHEENFNTQRMRIELDSFMETYEEELIKQGNIYLLKYNNGKSAKR